MKHIKTARTPIGSTKQVTDVDSRRRSELEAMAICETSEAEVSSEGSTDLGQIWLDLKENGDKGWRATDVEVMDDQGTKFQCLLCPLFSPPLPKGQSPFPSMSPTVTIDVEGKRPYMLILAIKHKVPTEELFP